MATLPELPDIFPDDYTPSHLAGPERPAEHIRNGLHLLAPLLLTADHETALVVLCVSQRLWKALRGLEGERQ